MTAIFEELQNAKEERDVDYIYSKYLEKFFKSSISHPFKCDGFLSTKTDNEKPVDLIIEYKYDCDFNKRRNIAEVLVQVIYYLKRFEENGQPLPNICLVGDKNECFVMHTDLLNKYLDEDIDWTLAPSGAKFMNPSLMCKIIDDKEINPFVFPINENFNIKKVIDRIVDLAENVQRKTKITVHNIETIYEYFCNRVIVNKNKYSTQDLVALFIGVLTDKINFYFHPKKNNVIVAQKLGKEFSVKTGTLKAFFDHFSDEYSVSEKRELSGIADRLIDDLNRRRSGDFWTPTIWVDYAQERLGEVLGENWRDEFVVWDNCAGTCNLTRDYKFKQLYISTLFDAELQIGMRFNKEAEHFQFDFLNDYIPMPNSLLEVNSKLPEGLLNAFKENKKILFFINPPYARQGKKNKLGVANTKTNKNMISDGFGNSCQNLYPQFLYRIEKIKREYNLTNCYIGVYSPINFLTGSSFKQFRKYFLKDFEYHSGLMFNSKEFSGVNSSWPICFTIWKSGETKDRCNFDFDICEVDKTSYSIEVKSQKTAYNTDNKEVLNEWAKEPIKNLNKVNAPNITSGIKVKTSTNTKVFKDAIGYVELGLSVGGSIQNIAIYSTPSSRGMGFGINLDNFIRSVSGFVSEMLVSQSWINDSEMFCKPNTEDSRFNEFANDSIIFSLFSKKSHQSSLRNVEYENKKWQIKNEFFWMSRDEIMDLADKNSNDECYDDAVTSKDRFVYNYLKSIKLSAEAQAVLDAANKLVRDSFKWREAFNIDNPNYQINNWDCGYYQLKALWKDYMPNEFAEFKKILKVLANKMRPMVYELGFLKK